MDGTTTDSGASHDQYAVSISDPGEVAAAVPHLLGFHPAESVVLISLTGPSGGRVGLTVRADIPPPRHAARLAAVLTRSIATDEPRAVLVAAFSEAPDDGRRSPELPHRALMHALVRALTDAGIPVRDLLLVRGGRWWSYDCPHPCCAPTAGTPVPREVSELAAAAVFSGMVVERDREELEARIAPLGGADGVASSSACLQVAGARFARAEEMGRDAVASEDWAAIRSAVRRCEPGATPSARLTDVDVARVVCALWNVPVRDRALQLALGDDAAAAEALWTECTRRAPTPLDAAPATLLAVSVWLRGDGAMANVALERALDSDPDYSLAQLLREALAACLPPAEIRAMVASTAAGGA